MGRRTRTGGEVVALQMIERRIYVIHGHNVMLDSDLAKLYGVTTGNLNLAVRRNRKRFPEDFLFQLSPAEASSLLLHSASSKGRGGRRTRPYAFTEQGVAMLSSVLRSERAIQVNIAIMRAFIRLREILAKDTELARKLKQMEEKYKDHEEQIHTIFETLQELIEAPEPPRRRIGFVPTT